LKKKTEKTTIPLKGKGKHSLSR